LDVNPDFEYVLWNETNIPSLSLSEDLLKNISDTKASRVIEVNKDYASMVILSKYGGIFMDLDYICTKSFSELVYRYTYFSAMEPPYLKYGILTTSVAIIGAAKGGQVMKTIRE
jgi:mannosyltransferase OCH1-like enzyme